VGVHRKVTRRAVFLDRDGVINKAVVRNGRPYPPADVRSLEILGGVPEALEALRAAGYVNVIVTNQPDIARGKTLLSTVDAIHDYLKSSLAIDGIYTCTHDDTAKCNCRKPAPGLLLRAADDLGIDLKSSFMVGDRWRDIEAGRAAGCRTAWIRYGYNEQDPQPPIDFVGDGLPSVADWILRENSNEKGERPKRQDIR
jgi:D-glycero-D-manno-heptose 1,7-bisphosphate phosphatase